MNLAPKKTFFIRLTVEYVGHEIGCNTNKPM